MGEAAGGEGSSDRHHEGNMGVGVGAVTVAGGDSGSVVA